jgi:phosphatidylserine/phosphatidylglycerophosphate/cardiolipin synthase-like enzyme
MDGAAARALGELARERWYRGTGEPLAPPPPGSDPWPERLPASLRGVDVALARTHPRRPGRQVVDRLRQGDRHHRFQIYQPVNAADTPIYVHAKILVIDDRLLRVAPPNFNNRSLGFDTECDVAIEAEPGAGGAATRAAIVGFRDSLVAEHLDVAPAVLRAAIAREVSQRAATESLRRPSGKTLIPLAVDPPNDAERLLAISRLVDPQRRPGLRREPDAAAGPA